MILSALLSIVFFSMAIYSVVFVSRASARYLLLLVYCAAIFFVWNPQSTTLIAHFFGIGRGLDFVIILLTVAIANGLIIIVRHLNSQHQSISELARYIAIRDAQVPTRDLDN